MYCCQHRIKSWDPVEHSSLAPSYRVTRSDSFSILQFSSDQISIPSVTSFFKPVFFYQTGLKLDPELWFLLFVFSTVRKLLFYPVSLALLEFRHYSSSCHGLKSLALHREFVSSSLNLFLQNFSYHLALDSSRIKSCIPSLSKELIPFWTCKAPLWIDTFLFNIRMSNIFLLYIRTYPPIPPMLKSVLLPKGGCT